jgi:hypothetical protein
LENHLNGLINQVAGFKGKTFGGVSITAPMISGRALDLVIPPTATAAQRTVITNAIRYGETRGVAVNVITHH